VQPFDRLRANGILGAVLAFFLAFAVTPAAAQTFPKLTGFVVDDANVLPPDVEASLTRKLDDLQKATNRQLVVATIADTQGYPLEEYGNKLLRSWGVGLKDANNGAILFVAPNNPAGQRGPRIEVGYGLEPILTDALSSVIINQDMMPRLRTGQVPQALEAGTDAIVGQLRASPEEQQAKVDAAVKQFDRGQRGQRSGDGGFPISLAFWGMILLFVLLSLGRRKHAKGRRYRGEGDSSGVLPVVLWSIANEIGREAGRGGGGWGGFSGGGDGGGWGGGGFTGGGGGSGGGGGASGSW